MADIGQYVERDILAEISVECQSICQLIHRSSVGRYVNQYIGRVSVHRLTDAQNTHDPKIIDAYCEHCPEWRHLKQTLMNRTSVDSKKQAGGFRKH